MEALGNINYQHQQQINNTFLYILKILLNFTASNTSNLAPRQI